MGDLQPRESSGKFCGSLDGYPSKSDNVFSKLEWILALLSNVKAFLKWPALFNDETCQTVQNWASDVRYIQGTEDYQFRDYTVQYLEQPENKQRILNLLRDADLGIEDIELIRPKKKASVAAVIKPDILNMTLIC